MEDALLKLVDEKMARIESHYPVWIEKNVITADTYMTRVAYYTMVSQVVLEEYLATDDDFVESELLEKLNAQILFYSKKLHNELRDDLEL